MISRREVVTAGVLGTLSASALAEADQSRRSATNDDATNVVGGLSDIKDELSSIKEILDDGMRKSSLAYGSIAALRTTFTTFLRANGKFPEYCEVGYDVFYNVYDWHVKHQQQINIVRLAENRMAIQYMFTQLILRWEQAAGYIGIPFDR